MGNSSPLGLMQILLITCARCVQKCVCVCLSVVVVATVCRPRELSAGVMAAFIHQLALESPTEEQRCTMLVSLSRHLPLGRDVNLERLAKLTAVCEQSNMRVKMNKSAQLNFSSSSFLLRVLCWGIYRLCWLRLVEQPAGG